MTAKRHEVVVGNIGSVYSGTNHDAARRVCAMYVDQITIPGARAHGEDVVWFIDGEVFFERYGELDLSPEQCAELDRQYEQFIDLDLLDAPPGWDHV